MSVVLNDLRKGNSGASAPPSRWYVRKQRDGKVYGPESVEVLTDWAAECRLLPGDELSADQKEWMPASELADLGMNWMATLPDGRSFGPFNLLATHVLFQHNKLPEDATLTDVRNGRTILVKDQLQLGAGQEVEDDDDDLNDADDPWADDEENDEGLPPVKKATAKKGAAKTENVEKTAEPAKPKPKSVPEAKEESAAAKPTTPATEPTAQSDTRAEKLEKQIEALKKELGDARKELKVAGETQAEQKKNWDAEKKKLATELENAKAAVDSEMAGTSEQVESLQKQLKKVEKDLKKSTEELRAREEDVSALKEKSSEQHRELEQRIESLESELEKRSEALKAAKESLAAQEKASAGSGEELEAIQQKLKAHQRESADTVEALRDQVQQLKDELEKVRGDLEQSHESLKEEQGRHEELRSSLHGDQQETVSKLAELEGLRDAAVEKLEKLEADHQKEKRELGARLAEMEGLLEEEQAKQKDLREQLKRAEATQGSADERFRAQRLEIENRSSRIRRELHVAQLSLEDAHRRMVWLWSVTAVTTCLALVFGWLWIRQTRSSGVGEAAGIENSDLGSGNETGHLSAGSGGETRDEDRPLPTAPPGRRVHPPSLDNIPGVTISVENGGRKIVFNDPVFSSGESLSTEGRRVLSLIADDIRDAMPGFVLTINGHTDNVPPGTGSRYRDNRELALERAKAVRDFMTNKQIPTNAMRAIASDRDPPYPNDTAANRAKNRTVTLLLTRRRRTP